MDTVVTMGHSLFTWAGFDVFINDTIWELMGIIIIYSLPEMSKYETYKWSGTLLSFMLYDINFYQII